MIQFKLPQKRQFQLNLDNNKIQLTVLENGTSWVCSKESFGKLQEFMSTDESRIFKGRLQLFKHGSEVSIEVKGEPIGVLNAVRFQKSLVTIKKEI